jgi:DNA phosphorothioation-dependent restriction protein DptH
MSQLFERVTKAEVNKAVEDVLFNQLRDLLQNREPGHCMRVSDLDPAVMRSLCERLHQAVTSPHVFLLSADGSKSEPILITGSKLVELRNPLPDGTLRSPLLVFVPNELKLASEDSFGVATFEQVHCAQAYDIVARQLIDALPEEIRSAVTEILALLREQSWKWANRLAVIRFLLSIRKNGNDAEVVGASLFEFALIPDFQLLDVPITLGLRLHRNRECMGVLTMSPKSERGRVMDLGLKNMDFKRKLGSFLAECELEDPLAWTSQIVLEQSNWQLSFDKWEFESSGTATQQICVELVSLDLPVVKPEDQDLRLKPLLNQQVLTLGRGGLKKFSVNFKTLPHPAEVPGLDHFRIEVVAKNTGPIGLAKKKGVWKTKRQDATVSISKLSHVDWEEGWHYARVTAHTKDGDPIPLVDTVGNPVLWSSASSDEPRRINESAEFYVFKGDDFDLEPTQRAVPRYPSLMHSLFDKQFSAILDGRDPNEISVTKAAWLDAGVVSDLKGIEFLEVKLGREGTCHIPVSKALKQVEQKILSSPCGPLSWRITISTGAAQEPLSDLCRWPGGEDVERFQAARTRYFEELSGKEAMLVAQAADFRRLITPATEYAEAYLRMVQQFLRRAEVMAGHEQQKAIDDLQTILCLDLVTLEHVNYRGQRSISVLVGPTHPLRALWLVTWTALAHEWLEKAKSGPREFVTSTALALSERLSLVNFPAVLSIGQGHLLIAIDNIHPFWTLYTTANEPNPRGLVAEACTALSLTEPNVGSFTLDGDYIAQKIRRYLLQHPYIETLIINVFNAGRGRLLVQALLALQRESVFADLRYNIRLFVPDPDAPAVGEDLSELLSPSGQTVAEEADAFAVPTGNHLFPKLSLAFLPTDDFRAAPEQFSAHLSILLDAFPPQEVTAQLPDQKDRGAPVHALVQDFRIHYVEDSDTISWTREPRHGPTQPIKGAEELPSLLAKLAEVLSNGAASVATGEAGMNLLPASRLVLGVEDRALLHQVHEISDWVFTIDRNVGVEFFDHADNVQRPEYLIDHSPEAAGSAGRRVVITSRSLTEIEAMMSRMLREHGLSQDSKRGTALLRRLRTLSGRLALKLLSSSTQRSEVLGLALAEMYLDYQQVLKDQIVVPLDDHLGLYRQFGAGLEDLGDEVSLRRTDLAIFDMDATKRTITCNLVEVKCYHRLGGVGAYIQLKESIAEQIQQSQKVLQYHFDPINPKDRPDRALKVQEFAGLLDYYTNRAARLGLLSAEAKDEAVFLLRTLERGYMLNFTRSALIFDFEKSGTENAVNEHGIEYHRIGFDLISTLLNSLPERQSEDSSGGAALKSVEQERTPPSAPKEGTTTEVPKLAKAAFISEKRIRTVSWDKLEDSSTNLDGIVVDEVQVSSAPLVPVADNAGTESPAEGQLASVGEVASPEGNGAGVPPSMPSSVTEKAKDAVSTLANGGEVTSYDVLLGATELSPQYGLLGEYHGRKIALDLNQTHTISLFGVQGGGKSYTLGTIIEMATMEIPGINKLPGPLATIVFHYSSTQDYEPEFTSMNRPNLDARAAELLKKDFGARPAALQDVILLAPRDKISERREQYPSIPIYPLAFCSSELQAAHWKFLMGAVGNQATYIRQINQLMRSMRNNLTLEGLRQAIQDSSLADTMKGLALNRLSLASEYIDDAARLGDLVVPGRLIIVDLRDEFIEKDEALGLFVVLLQIFADAKHGNQRFNKLVVFDEAHKYIENPDLVDGLVSVVREMRHKGTSVLVASQDPPSVPIALIELSSHIILHRFNSPAWLKHIQKANASLTNLSAEQMSRLAPGDAYVWSSKATDIAFSREPLRVTCRPRVTAHGGSTKTAV